MRKFKHAVGLLVVVGLLSACGGLIGQLIGAQRAENALGLDTSEVAAIKDSAEPAFESAGVGALAVPESFTGVMSGKFKDVDWEAIQAEAPVALPAPKSYSEEIGIEADVSVRAPGEEADLPELLTLTGFVLTVRVTDSSGAPSFEKTFGESGNVSIQFAKGACEPGIAEVTCSYSTDASASELVNLIDLSVAGSEFSSLWNDILTNQNPDGQAASSDQNSITGTVELYVDAGTATPANTTITVQLDTAEGTIDFAK